ncbi:hypothetical protein CYMTET_51243 [Cymbomonas tetramitiformis]|uniref:Uncharacterized protein n=1 Tax=Cymbomonas tetramitiformis TaxID=36881 RepID=A0AAE0ES11_9CHLO|nr:hypothetical protein CYMTET_51243 [Cymbomonas tetramitiformis]
MGGLKVASDWVTILDVTDSANQGSHRRLTSEQITCDVQSQTLFLEDSDVLAAFTEKLASSPDALFEFAPLLADAVVSGEVRETVKLLEGAPMPPPLLPPIPPPLPPSPPHPPLPPPSPLLPPTPPNTEDAESSNGGGEMGETWMIIAMITAVGLVGLFCAANKRLCRVRQNHSAKIVDSSSLEKRIGSPEDASSTDSLLDPDPSSEVQETPEMEVSNDTPESTEQQPGRGGRTEDERRDVPSSDSFSDPDPSVEVQETPETEFSNDTPGSTEQQPGRGGRTEDERRSLLGLQPLLGDSGVPRAHAKLPDPLSLGTGGASGQRKGLLEPLSPASEGLGSGRKER